MTATFTIGSKVVHPCYGAGTIVRIQEKSIGETNNLYYIIRPISCDMQLMVPVDRADELNLRPVGTPTGLRKALCESYPDTNYMNTYRDLRQRQNAMREQLKSGSFTEVVRVTQTLYALSAKRSLGMVDRQLLDQGKELLAGELALAANVELDEAMREVEATLQQASEAPDETSPAE